MQDKFWICIDGWFFGNNGLVGIFYYGIGQHIIFTEAAEINSGPASRKIPVVFVEPVSLEGYAVRLCSVRNQCAINNERRISVEMYPCAGIYGKGYTGIDLDSTNNNIR